MTRFILIATVLGAVLAGCQGEGYETRRQQRLASLVATEAARPTTHDAPAQPLPENASLGETLDYAALHSPQLRAAFNRWKAAVARVPQAGALPDPRFTYRYYLQEVETRVGPQRQAFALSQKFPWIGKLRAREDAAAQTAEAQRQRFEAEKLKLFYDVQDAWIELWYIERAAEILAQNVELLENVEAVARTRYEVGEAEHPDLIRAQVELGRLVDDLESLREMREPVVARLNAALGRPVTAPIATPDAMPDREITVADEQLIAWQRELNPTLRAAAHEIAAREHQVELARQEYIPDITLGVNYIDTGNSIANRRPEDDGKDPVIASAGVNLPIWREKLAAGVREAQRGYDAAVRDREQAEHTLAAELTTALYHYHDARRKIALYRDTLLPKAREALTSTQTSFSAGRSDFNALLDAERILLDFELQHQRARARQVRRLAEVEMLVGRDLGVTEANLDAQTAYE